MEDLTVLNFGTYLSGPMTARHLQNMGAHIITVKMHETNTPELVWNKHIVEELIDAHEIHYINLKTEWDRIIPLIKRADVLIENFRPGVMNRLNLSYETCKNMNDLIIYVSLPGFSSTDKEFSNERGWDNVVMAGSGVFKDMGLNRQLMKIPASYSSLHLPSSYASMFAAFAIASKYFLLKRSGKLVNSKIEISSASSLSEALVHNSINFPIPYSYLTFRKLRLLQNAKALTYTEVTNLMDPFFSHYMCADNRPFYLVAPSHITHQRKVITVLNLEHMMSKIRIADPYNKYSSNKTGLGGAHVGQQSSILRAIFAKKFKQKTSFEWEKIFGENGIPTSAHRTFYEWLESDHANDSGLCSINENGNVKLGPLAWLNNIKDVEDTSYLKSDNPDFCLSDIKVLDLSNVIAGPTIGCMLARMGADVLKIDSTIPTYAPNITIIYGLAANKGKTSILLDITTLDGRNKLNRLIQISHIIIVNSTQNRLQQLSLSCEKIRQINSQIILVHFDAFGGPNEKGSMSEYLGYDDNVQATQGIMERFGGGLQHVEEHAHIGTIDVIAGVSGAFATVCALLKLLLQKKSSVARTSLSAVGQYIQFSFSCGNISQLKALALHSVDRLGTACRGEHVINRCYRAKDGWFMFVGSYVYNEDKLRHILKILSNNEISIANCEMFISETLTQKNILEWKTIFKNEGISIMPLRSLKEIRDTYIVEQVDVAGGSYQFLEESHPIGKLVSVAPIAIRTTDLQLNLNFSPKYGTNNMDYFPDSTNIEWSSNYLPYMDECPICFEQIEKPFKIQCEHTICAKCATVCSMQGLNKCPLCRADFDLNSINIQLKMKTFRTSYAAWRKGNKSGAKDMERIPRNKTDINLLMKNSLPRSSSF